MSQPSVLVALNNETSQKQLVHNLERAGVSVEELKTSDDVVTGVALIEHMNRLKEAGSVPQVVVIPPHFGDDDSDAYFMQMVRTLRGRKFRARVAIVAELWKGPVVVRSMESGADALLSISASRHKVTAATARNVFELATVSKPTLRFEISNHFNAWQAMHDHRNGWVVDQRSLSVAFSRNVDREIDSLHVRAIANSSNDAPGVVLFYHGNRRDRIATALSSRGFNVFSPATVADFKRAYLCGDTTVVFDPRSGSRYADKLFYDGGDYPSRFVLLSNFDREEVERFTDAGFSFGEVFALVDERDDFETTLKILTGQVQEGDRLNGALVSPTVRKAIGDHIKLDSPDDPVSKPHVIVDLQWSASYSELLAKSLRRHGLEVVTMERFLQKPNRGEVHICVSGRDDDTSFFQNGSERYSGLKFVIVDSLDNAKVREYVQRRDVIGLFDLSDDPTFIASSIEDLADGSVFRFMSRAVREAANVADINVAESFTTF